MTLLFFGLTFFLQPLFASREASTFSGCPILLAALHQGRLLDKVAVITHQIPPLRAETNARLQAADLKDTPVVVLDYPIPGYRFEQELDPAHKDRAVIVADSDGNYNPLVLNAQEIVLMGGSCGACLERTFANLVSDFKKSSRTELKITLLVELTYGADQSMSYAVSRLTRSLDTWKMKRTAPNKFIFQLPPSPQSIYLEIQGDPAASYSGP